MNDTIHCLTERPLVWDAALLTDGLSPDAVQTVTAVRPARPDRVWVIIDHDTPAGSVAAAEHQAHLQRFARENGLSFTCGRGVGYHLLAQQGIAGPGQVVIGCGRHMAAVGAAGALGLTLTPEAMARALETGTVSLEDAPLRRTELTGVLDPYVTARDLALTLAADRSLRGAVLAVHGPQLTEAQRWEVCALLADAQVKSVFFTQEPGGQPLDLARVHPMAALPGKPLTEPVPAAYIDGIRVNQVFIGGCAGGTLEALRLTARLWQGRKVSPYVRVLVAPCTSQVYLQALEEGLMDIFLDAGALVMNQGCSACWAQSQGRCSTGEVFATTGCIHRPDWAGQGSSIYPVSVPNAAQAALSGSIYES